MLDVVLRPGAPTDTLRTPLLGPSTLTGRVVDGRGQPLSGVQVSVGFTRVRTGADGRFRARGVWSTPVMVAARLGDAAEVLEVHVARRWTWRRSGWTPRADRRRASRAGCGGC